MKYFTYISITYTVKNQLAKAILAFLKSQERLVIDSKNIEVFKTALLQEISNINLQYPRCKPVQAHWYNSGLHALDLHLSGIDVCNFYLYQSQNNEDAYWNTKLIIQLDEIKLDRQEVINKSKKILKKH